MVLYTITKLRTITVFYTAKSSQMVTIYYFKTTKIEAEIKMLKFRKAEGINIINTEFNEIGGKIITCSHIKLKIILHIVVLPIYHGHNKSHVRRK